MLRTSRRLAALTSVALLGALAYPGGSVAWAASTVDQAQDATPVGAFPISAAESTAQSFTAGRTGRLDQVDLQIFPNGDASEDVLTVTVRTLTGSPALPSDEVLAEASVVAKTMPSGMQWNNLQLDSPVQVTAGQQYALVLTSPADPFGERFGWGYVNSTTYAAGSAFTADDAGSWSARETQDMNFRTYVDPGEDIDGDGFGEFQDCNETTPEISPGATETFNGVDDDCDGTIDEGFSTSSAPRIGTASSGAVGGAVNATARWARPLTDGGLAVTGYKVQAQKLNAAGSVVSRVTKTTGPAARSLVVKLAAGRYKFRVAAVNAAGPSAWSANSAIVKAR